MTKGEYKKTKKNDKQISMKLAKMFGSFFVTKIYCEKWKSTRSKVCTRLDPSSQTPKKCTAFCYFDPQVNL